MGKKAVAWVNTWLSESLCLEGQSGPQDASQKVGRDFPQLINAKTLSIFIKVGFKN
jgi:hypothetical protein